MFSKIGVSLFVISAALVSACEVITPMVIPQSAYVQPASASKAISTSSVDNAMKAALAAATANNWTPKTVSAETGFMFAEREIRVVGRSNRDDSYNLEVNLPTSGRGEVTAKVTPPPGVVGGESTENMVAQYLSTLEASLSK